MPMNSRSLAIAATVFAGLVFDFTPLRAQDRPRSRELGVAPGILPTGPLNAITDVAGVLVGQVTVIEADSVRTGITAILPHAGNLFLQRVPAAVVVGNGFGKLLGSTQVNELGELETPILLTCTLCVWKAADAMVEWMLAQPGMENVRSINPVVGETNDGYELNTAIRSRPITAGQVRQALTSARGGPVEEGSVGAGRGTRAFEWKGGIGTSSRHVPPPLGGWTVGVLVQTNFGGVLQIMGAPVGRELNAHKFSRALREKADGSIMIVVATDAPLSDRNLKRLASRAFMGLARTGSVASNGCGGSSSAVPLATDPDEIERINGHRPIARRPVEMRTCYASRVTNKSDQLTSLHDVANRDERFAKVKICGDDSAAVIDVDHVTGEKKVVDECNHSAVRRTHRLSNRSPEIDTEMSCGHLTVEQPTRSEF